MKKRNGFVSNSSSASFIMIFKSKRNKEEIIRDINDSRKWYDAMGYNFKTDLVEKNGEYLFSAETTMFNDWYDLACWPFIRMLDERANDDYELMSFRKVEEEWSSCDYEVRFDPRTWETKDVEFYKAEKERISRKAKKTASSNQEAYDNFYETYLRHLKDNTISLSVVELSSDYFEDKYGG